MRDVLSLNISNTYRAANCHVRVRKKPNEILDYHKLTASKLHKLYDHMQSLKKQKSSFKGLFVGHHNSQEDMPKERQIALDGFPFYYYSDTTFPIAMITACHDNQNAICMYNYHGRISDKTLSSMFRASMICRLGIRVPIILGRTDLLSVLVWLFASRFIVERVELDFVGLTKDKVHKLVPHSLQGYYKRHGKLYYPFTKARLICYSKLHEVLARGKYQLFLICETPQQAKDVKQKGLKIANE